MVSDVSIIQEMMDVVEEERNKELKRKTRIIGEALDALNNFSEFKNAKWFGRGDSWTRTYAGPDNDPEWPEYRTWAHFMLWPLEGVIPEILDQAEEDRDYEAWLTSKQYVKSLEEYNRHKLLACEKGQSPDWVGECTEDKATTTVITSDNVARSYTNVPTEKCVLYNTFLKDRFKLMLSSGPSFQISGARRAMQRLHLLLGTFISPIASTAISVNLDHHNK